MRTLLLDGLWGNPARLYLMKRRLVASGLGEVESFGYRSDGFASIDSQAAKLAERVRSLGEAPNLVGYSMGGLVIRAARLLDPDLPIRKAAFLNTPHAGSLVAKFVPGAGIRQMRPGDPLLERLAAAPWEVPTLAVWTPGDLMVVPAHSARWSRATRVTACGVPAHIWPIFSARVHYQVAEFLLEPA